MGARRFVSALNRHRLRQRELKDLDAIISITQEKALTEDLSFWDAVEGANKELEPQGLYITHLFSEREIFLRKNWEPDVVLVTRPILRKLRVFRPATIDLILSKMMRGDDAYDMSDAEFMIRRDGITEEQLLKAFAE